MYTLKDAASMFAKLDGISNSDYTSYDKSLRDISQRFYLPHSGMKGRASQYDRPQVCALRIIQTVYGFQIPRDRLNLLALFMFRKVSRSKRTVIEEAISRVEQGESFEFSIEMANSKTFNVTTNWKSKLDPKAERVMKNVELQDPWDTRLCVPASRLIFEVLAITAGPILGNK